MIPPRTLVARHNTIYLVPSAFTSRPTSLLTYNGGSVILLFMLHMFSSRAVTPSEPNSSW